MNKSITFLVFIVAQNVFALNMFCQQNPRDVRFELTISEQKVKLLVYSPLGYSYLPMMDAPVSESSISHLKYQTGQLRPLGDQFWAEWNVKDCKYQIDLSLAEPMLECGKAGKTSTDKIEFLTFTIATITDQSLAGTFKNLRFRMSLSAEGEYGSDYFFIALNAPKKSCGISKSPLKANL